MGPGGRRALLLGWRGGVGTAVTGLLQHHPAGQRVRDALHELHLVDEVDGPPPSLRGAHALPPRRVDTPAELAELIHAHRIDQVIEIASVDTMRFARACARLGVDYLSTSMGVGDVDDPHADEHLTMATSAHLVPDRRPQLDGGSHLIGSGMNPGVVNALVLAGLDELARRVDAAPEPAALELYGIYFTERDTTAPAAGPPDDDVFAMSWSPRHCLEEILEPEAMAFRDGEPVGLGHPPHRRWYRARCGREEVPMMVVPHEEVVTIGDRFAPVESAFLYAIPPAATRALLRAPERPIDGWTTRRLYPPAESRLVGGDRVGALLCSRRHGELWIGFDTPVARGLQHGTNATQLQVAAGVLAGWWQLGARRGIHVVEELDWRAYLATVESVLGPRQVHHVPDAPPRTLRQRALPEPTPLPDRVSS